MLCNNCGKKNATIRYEENINGESKKINLCEECGYKLGILNMNFMDNMFLSFFDEPKTLGIEKIEKVNCPKCGYSFDDYKRTGLLGCNECYKTFESKLEPILYKLHGRKNHVKNIKNGVKSLDELGKLKQELEIAIKNEEYENAAIIRDKIRDIEKRGEK